MGSFSQGIFKILQDFRAKNPTDSNWMIAEDMTDYISSLRPYSRQKRGPLKKIISDVIQQMKENAIIEDGETLDIDGAVDDGNDNFENMDESNVFDGGNQKLNDPLLSRYKAIADEEKLKRGAEESPSTLEKSTNNVISREKKKSKKSSSSSTEKTKTSEPTSYLCERPSQKFSDFGGIESVLQDIHELVERPFKYPQIYKHLGVEPPRGILLHGPPGCGKTGLALAIAGELGVSFLKISAPEIVSGMSGESETKIRELFDQAKEVAPSIIFIDEIDAITPKRETAQREMERRIVAQLLTCLDDLNGNDADAWDKPIVIIGATNRPDALDPALRRAGRFDREIRVGIPDEACRTKILQVLTSNLKLSGQLDVNSIAKKTPGYVGADLKALVREAATITINRVFKEIKEKESNEMIDDLQQLTNEEKPDKVAKVHFSPEDLSLIAIEERDFTEAIPKVQPSAKREGFAVVPDVSWDDIGALSNIRDELRMAIVEPARHPEKFAAVGITAPAGVLLWGPPGCGKTLLAKAVANESHSNFISVKGPELLNKYVGESERAVRQVFERARASAPCVIFFDELDALCPRRNDESNSSTARVVNQLLTEMDGLESRKQVFIIAATNRPDIIDPAILRPGRLDKLLYVELPSVEERFEILKTITKKIPLSSDVDLQKLANDQRCIGFSGADLSSLVREAGYSAIKSNLLLFGDNNTNENQIQQQILINSDNFDSAFSAIYPSVSADDQKRYDALHREFTRRR